MTENAAGAAVNHPDDYKMGTVGQAIPARRCASVRTTRCSSRART